MSGPLPNTSIPIQNSSRWSLRVLGGTSAGLEFPLMMGTHVIGSAPGVTIQIPAAGIAPRHCELAVGTSGLRANPLAAGVRINGGEIRGTTTFAGGDVLEIGPLQLQLVDTQSSRGRTPIGQWGVLSRLPGWVQLTAALAAISVGLVIAMTATQNPHLVPITTLTASAVVPVGVLGFVYARFGTAAASLRSVAITLGLGATVGILVTVLLASLTDFGGTAIAAPLFEEPAKVLATVWCWHRVGYRSPRSGLLLGLAAGSGFAIAETAGYVFRYTAEEGAGAGLTVLLVRSLLSPFAHGAWTAMAASAWFQCDWAFRGAWKPIFGRALLIAMGLHMTWNSGSCAALIVSAAASAWLFWRLLKIGGTWRAQWALQP